MPIIELLLLSPAHRLTDAERPGLRPHAERGNEVRRIVLPGNDLRLIQRYWGLPAVTIAGQTLLGVQRRASPPAK